MKKIFFDSEISNLEKKICIENGDYHHLANVLRVKKGEKFVVGDINNNEFDGKIVDIDKNKITIKLVDKLQRRISKPNLTLIFSILKGDKNDNIIQKCTEIGVNRFVPVITENTIVELKNNKTKKIQRWKKITKEAAMQSCREKVPEILDIMMFDEIKEYDIKSAKYFCYIDERDFHIKIKIDEIHKDDKIAFFIGPEGGFTKNEADCLNENNWQGVKLSPFVFRSETSAIFISSIILSK